MVSGQLGTSEDCTRLCRNASAMIWVYGWLPSRYNHQHYTTSSGGCPCGGNMSATQWPVLWHKMRSHWPLSLQAGSVNRVPMMWGIIIQWFVRQLINPSVSQHHLCLSVSGWVSEVISFSAFNTHGYYIYTNVIKLW